MARYSYRWTEDDTLYRQALDEDIAKARRQMGKDGPVASVYQERDQLRAHGMSEHAPRDYLADLSRIAQSGGESMKGVAEDYAALSGEIAQRLAGVPRVVRRGDNLVPVAIDVRARPIVSDEELAWRDQQAARDRTVSTRRQCLAMYTHAQQSESVGLHFMTPNERKVASIEWAAQLRAKVKASDDARKHAERTRVLVDVQDID